MTTIILHQFPSIKTVPNLSPFCMKLECFLRMADLQYTVKKCMNPGKGPVGKMPCLEIDGKRLYDSGLIIDYLQAQQKNIDAHLSAAQQADALMVRRMLEEHLYWGIVYSRWIDPAGWLQWKKIMFAKLPFFLRGAVSVMAKRGVKAELHGHGLGRHRPEDIDRLMNNDLHALATLLGQKPYYFGEKASSIDAAICAAVGAILFTPWDYSLKAAVFSHQNLLDHYARMIKAYFPEYPAQAR